MNNLGVGSIKYVCTDTNQTLVKGGNINCLKDEFQSCVQVQRCTVLGTLCENLCIN